MQRLSGLDAAFLSLETPNTPMNVVGTILLDPSTAEDGFSRGQVLRLLAARLHRLPPLRRRLAEVPFGLGHPVWIEDSEFTLEDHVSRVVAPAPGSERILAEIVGRFAARPLDRSRPLWEMQVVENLCEGRVALLVKMHHAVADGIASAQMIVQLLDTEPDPAPAEPPPEWRPEATPSSVVLLGRALFGLATQPARMLPILKDTAKTAAEMAGRALGPPGAGLPAALPFTAPRTRFNGSVSPGRVVAYARVGFRELHFVKSVFRASINDVILAACTSSLRSYLEAHDDPPREPLVATIPVCVRRGKEWGQQGNRVSALFVHLPVQLADPLDQLLAIRASVRSAKRFHDALGPNKLRDWAQWTTPAVLSNAVRLYSRLELAKRHRPIHNLVISNVPGPTSPLYAAGARVVALHPHGPIFQGAGVNITVMSYVDSMDFGILACEKSVPDVDSIAHGFGAGVGNLVKLALLETPQASSGTRPRSATAHHVP